MKSLVPFCPVTCGCIDDPSRHGCPGTCNATDAAEPLTPVCRDLSDAQLVLASDARVARYKFIGLTRPEPYPPSCSGANAMVCAQLGIDSYGTVSRHPCPKACRVCLCRGLSEAELRLTRANDARGTMRARTLTLRAAASRESAGCFRNLHRAAALQWASSHTLWHTSYATTWDRDANATRTSRPDLKIDVPARLSGSK